MQGKQILITGATDGIGLAAAERLSRSEPSSPSSRATSTRRVTPPRAFPRLAAAAHNPVDRADGESGLAGIGSSAGRRGARPLSPARHPDQQCGSHVHDAAAEPRRPRVDLGGQPPGAVPPHHPVARSAAGERAGARSSPPRRARTWRRASRSRISSGRALLSRPSAATARPSSPISCSRPSWRGGSRAAA